MRLNLISKIGPCFFVSMFLLANITSFAQSDEDRLKEFAGEISEIDAEAQEPAETIADPRMASFADQIKEINESCTNEIVDDVIIQIPKTNAIEKAKDHISANEVLIKNINLNTTGAIIAEVAAPEFPTSDWTRYGTQLVDLGQFTLTAYDACLLCCGKTDGITASGTKCYSGRTIAVDPDVIPIGSKVVIAGYVFVAEDTGSKVKGNHIDLYMETHELARNFGKQTADVQLVVDY
ncbi:MAG: 3D domain-containing protein [Butyrivibrio sp.]|nr:3D domain-containing protein [Butyrivibrio sp.]